MFQQRRSHSVPLGIRSPRRRSAPTESDKDVPPSVALSPTPLGLLSLSLKPGTEAEPMQHQTMGIRPMHTRTFICGALKLPHKSASQDIQHGCIKLQPKLDTLKAKLTYISNVN